jgi:hypothetical protein
MLSQTDSNLLAGPTLMATTERWPWRFPTRQNCLADGIYKTSDQTLHVEKTHA